MLPQKVWLTLLCCLAQLSLITAGFPQEQDPAHGALSIQIQNLDFDEGFVEYYVLNETEHPLTALAYHIVILYQDGSRFTDPRIFECIYSSHLPKPQHIQDLYSGKGPVWSRQAVRFRDAIPNKPGTEVIAVYVEPQAAVMLNRTAIGNKELLSRIADRRRGVFEALETWVPVFELTLAETLAGRDSLEEAIGTLVTRVDKTVSQRSYLTAPQRNHARAYERFLGEQAQSLLKSAKQNDDYGVRNLARQVELYRAQLIASQDSWNFIESKESAR
ncbi:MAG TPA: hypothetical protein VLU25_07880 [Acidobacteriota bacterium]|nr:hypothetical protein [Acidobacteriota bacterium]